MRIFDTSHYCEDSITNYLIEILPVNKTKWVTFHVKKHFSLAVNSSSLGYKRVADIEKLQDLPDGIYEIKQSYKPNIHTLQHYYHFRITDLRVKIKKEWDKLVAKECKISREEYYLNRDKLREIDELAYAAKFKVEECGEKAEGKEIYDWAVKLLEQYASKCQC
jgi:hypothetical protein